MKKVILTKRASIRLEELFHYLETKWSIKTRNEFIKKFGHAIFLIRKYPEIAPKSLVIPNLHRYILTKQTSIFYRNDKASITIIAIFDNRMNPEKLNEQF